MLADWSVECAADDPVLVIPWKDPAGTAEFIDLRADPYDLHSIPEAEEHPPLMQALRALNATRSPVFTAKCDAWPMDAGEVEQLSRELAYEFAAVESDLDAASGARPEADCTSSASAPGDEADPVLSSGYASYIDLVWRERSVFVSFHQQEQMLQRLVRHATALNYPSAALECVLRPALVDLDGPQEGFAVSLYVKGLASSAESALAEWGAALSAVVALIRSRELAGTTAGRVHSRPGRSVTID